MTALVVHDDILVTFGVAAKGAIDAIAKPLNHLNRHSTFAGTVHNPTNARADLDRPRVTQIGNDPTVITHEIPSNAHTPHEDAMRAESGTQHGSAIWSISESVSQLITRLPSLSELQS